MRCSTLLALAASVSSASAHYFFPHLIANGNFTGYYEYVRDNSANYMPFKNGYDSTDLRCRTGSMEHTAATGVYKVKAGDEVGFGLNFGGSIQNPGTMQAYLSKAPGDVREYEGDGDWFKIFEPGPKSFSSEGIEWGVTNVGNFTFKLPEEMPAGQYLLRIEHDGVHGAGDFGGAEFYFNCAQIEVESSSTAVPGPTVKIPRLYDGHEPGIEFYMYRPWIVNFTMPGRARWPQALLEKHHRRRCKCGSDSYALDTPGSHFNSWRARYFIFGGCRRAHEPYLRSCAFCECHVLVRIYDYS
ncbi:cellulose-growth-specific protein [Colletotrichum salicis]|uniref:lytic cellulose monooxygenase (C4-dehydrogenating) n=1 Tax=Colletotrichum salicis TaxID=1209931 RepID=A0A135V6R4_9PEZI|nr:cellulose-growth-specific protein [Colletotrichum salicis]